MVYKTTWFFLMLALLASACDKKHDDTSIVIGAYLPMTGPTGDFGQKTLLGIQLALEETNRNGGVHGKKLKLVVLDDQSRADETANAVIRLIDLENVVAIIGEITSSLSLVGGRVCQRRKIPMVSPSSTYYKVTQIGDYVFRACFIDAFQGLAMAKFMREELHMKRVALLSDVRCDYCVGLGDAFRARWKELGGEIALEASYHQGDTDFGAQLISIESANVEGVYIPGYYNEVGNIARQSRRLGLNVPFFGGDGWESPHLHAIGGADIVGSYFTTDFSPHNPESRSRQFTDAFKAKYHELPSGLSAQGYDSAGLVIDALKRAATPTPRAIRDALATTRDYLGVTGSITMDSQRNPLKPAVVVRLERNYERFSALVQP